jgi:hypothetical protein
MPPFVAVECSLLAADRTSSTGGMHANLGGVMAKTDCVIKCANCGHYQEEAGQCRRYPPVHMLTDEGGFWEFPDVDPDDWCGEFDGRN